MDRQVGQLPAKDRAGLRSNHPPWTYSDEKPTGRQRGFGLTSTSKYDNAQKIPVSSDAPFASGSEEEQEEVITISNLGDALLFNGDGAESEEAVIARTNEGES